LAESVEGTDASVFGDDLNGKRLVMAKKKKAAKKKTARKKK
jgi:hypothetical protein